MDYSLSKLSKSGEQLAAVMAVNYSITCSNDELRLFCWILGGSNAFSVKIGKSEIVDELKKRIKKAGEPELDYLAADALSVWKVGKSYQRLSIGRSNVWKAILTHSFCGNPCEAWTRSKPRRDFRLLQIRFF